MPIPIYSLTVYGEPVAQGRARSVLIKKKDGGQFISHYDPAKSRNYKDLIIQHIIVDGVPETLLDEALVLSIIIYRTKPKSKKVTDVFPITKPDLDNYVKSAKDAMNKMIYRDDSIIVGYTDSWKLYTLERPRLEIRLFKATEIFEISNRL